MRAATFATAALLLGLTAAAAQETGDATDPHTLGAFELIGNSSCVGVQLAAIPGTTMFLFMERPTDRHPDGGHANACTMDSLTGGSFEIHTNFSMENCGHTFLRNGTVAILSGHKPQSGYVEGRKAIQILDLENRVLRSVGQLQFGHWLTTATRLPNGKITVMSDSPAGQGIGPLPTDPVENPFYELWDPESPASTTLHQLNKSFTANTKYFYYPFNFVLPTGDMFVWSNNYGQIINPLTGQTVMVLPRWLDQIKGIMTAYPFSGTAVMLPLSYKDNYTVAEIVIFGGQWSKGWINSTAVDRSMRLRLEIGDDGSYRTDGWKLERMPSPRVTGTSVLLPNKMVLLINGAKRGLMGDAAAGGVAMCQEPNFWPVLYDPLAPEGSRYTTLARSQVARLLHSTAGLTINGSVMVAGGDRSDRFWNPPEVPYSPSPWGFPEYRVELFHTPFEYDTQHRPVIVKAPTAWQMGSHETITFTLPDAFSTVDSVMLMAPSSNTHTFDMHQRAVELDILAYDTDANHVTSSSASATASTTASGKAGSSTAERTVVVRGPPNANVAPPGVYMLFLVSGRTFGSGVWVTVTEEGAVGAQ